MQLFSTFTGIGLVYMQYYEEKRIRSLDDESQRINIDKFKLSDLKLMNNWFFWLLVINCVLTYNGIFPYLEVVT